MSSSGPSWGLFGPCHIMADSSDQLKELTKYIKELADTAKYANPTIDKLKKGLADSLKALDQELSERAKNAKGINGLTKLFDELETELAKNKKLYRENAKSLAEMHAHISENIDDEKEKKKLNGELNKLVNQQIANNKTLAKVAAKNNINLKGTGDQLAIMRDNVALTTRQRTALNKIEKDIIAGFAANAAKLEAAGLALNEATASFEKTAPVVDYFGRTMHEGNEAVKKFIGGLTLTAGLTRVLEGLKQGLMEFKDLSSKGLAGAFTQMSLSALSAGMNLKDFTEVISQNRLAINQLGGGVKGLSNFTDIINNSAKDLKDVLPVQADAFKAQAEIAGLAQSMGSTGQNISGTMSKLNKSFLRMNKITGETVTEYVHNRKALIDSTEVQQSVIGLTKQDRTQKFDEIRAEYDHLKLLGLSNEQARQQIQQNKSMLDAKKYGPVQRMTETIQTGNWLKMLQAQGAEIADADIQAAIKDLRSGKSSAEGDEAKKRLASAIDAHTRYADENDTGIGNVSTNIMMGMAGQMGQQGILEQGRALAIAGQQGKNLVPAEGALAGANKQLQEGNKHAQDAVNWLSRIYNFLDSTIGKLLSGILIGATGYAIASLKASGLLGSILQGGFTGLGGKLTKLGSFLGKGLGVTAAAIAGWEVGGVINDQLEEHAPGVKEAGGNAIAMMLGQTNQVARNADIGANITKASPVKKRSTAGQDVVGKPFNISQSAAGPSASPNAGAAGIDKIDFTRYATTVGNRESGSDPSKVNTLGYLGKYQFGAAALQDLGLVKKGTSQRGLDNDANWNLPGGKAAFLANPALQEQMFQKYTQMNYNTLTRMGVISSNSSPDQIAGALMAAHLKGPGGAANLIKGGIDSTDAYGTSAQSYFKLGAASQLNTGNLNANTAPGAGAPGTSGVTPTNVNSTTNDPMVAMMQQNNAALMEIARNTGVTANARGKLASSLPTQQASEGVAANAAGVV